MKILFAFMVTTLLLQINATQAYSAVVTFDELTSFNGESTNLQGTKSGDFYSGTLNVDGWTSGGVFFDNEVDPIFSSWDGWSYSNVVDSTRPGFFNQYAAFPGGGSNGQGGVDVGGTYAVAYFSEFAFTSPQPRRPYFNLPAGFQIQSADFSNTTYTELGILGNDGFNNTSTLGPGDFARAIFTGYQDLNAMGPETGTVVLTLADYTAGQNFRLSNWTTTALSGLGDAKSIAFVFQSSNVNLPSYLAMDNLTLTAVPEPGSLLTLSIMVVVSLAGLKRFRSRRLAFRTPS